MHFCPNCENMLWPRRKKLYCKICNDEFDLKTNKNDYKLSKIIRHNESEREPIIIENAQKDQMSEEDRKAYEDFFYTSEEY